MKSSPRQMLGNDGLRAVAAPQWRWNGSTMSAMGGAALYWHWLKPNTEQQPPLGIYHLETYIKGWALGGANLWLIPCKNTGVER